MACPGLATHTMAGLCALRLPSAASSSTKGYLTSKKRKFNTDLGCKNDAALLTYTFNKESWTYNES